MSAAALPLKRVQFAGVLMLGMASLVWADKVAEVSADFLEYLGSLDNEDDNWTDFTAEAVAARQPATTVAAASSSSAGSRNAAATSSKSASSDTGKAGK